MGRGRVFALYVAGYTAGRVWIEMMRTDQATHLLGIRINVFTSVVVFLLAVLYLVLVRGKREDPETLRGKPLPGDDDYDDGSSGGAKQPAADEAAEAPADESGRSESGDSKSGSKSGDSETSDSETSGSGRDAEASDAELADGRPHSETFSVKSVVGEESAAEQADGAGEKRD